ncbi:AIPR family protein [Pseudomonas aeruginosa]|nr:AIPR family protein [Pseudomonas aeruginosa]
MSQKTISNKIILGILDEFGKDFKFGAQAESKLFERLVNYVTLSKSDPEAFSDASTFDLVDVDKGSTYGIDTFALFINDTLIQSKESIAAFTQTKRLDAKLVFIQTKRSTSFDTGEFLKFTSAIKNFLSDEPEIDLSDELKEAKELVTELFLPQNARIFSKKRPKCEIYFATSGTRTESDSISGVIKQQELQLSGDYPEYESIIIKTIDADYIIDSYNEIENKSTILIDFEQSLSCGKIDGVEQSFIGYLPIDEFLKLVTGADGNIRKNLFYENVRDFQGQANTVNAEIAETLMDPAKIDKFLLLNNGITIVAKEFSNIRSKEYEISDYYIVNGCQTSNVLFQNSNSIPDRSNLNIPIKIVHTTDNNVIASLIRSTNRQTPVPDEAFVSLEKFHKRLQEYYKRFSQECFEDLYYERRSKEFSNSMERVEKPRIVNLHGQIRSFTSIILGEPQLAMANNPTSVLKEHDSKMFQTDHVHTPYFLASLLLYLFYVHTEEGKISKKYVISRYWICWIARVLLFKSLDPGQMNSSKTEKRCEQIIEHISTPSNILQTFREATKVFEDAKKTHRNTQGRQLNTQLVRLKTFRDTVKRQLISTMK